MSWDSSPAEASPNNLCPKAPKSIPKRSKRPLPPSRNSRPSGTPCTFFPEVVIPTERVSEVKRGKKIESERKLHPGYVYINMFLRDEDKKLVDRTWYFIRETNGVIGFADGDNPQPIRASEVDTMLGQMREREEKVLPKIAFTVGDKVKVGDGPFQNQEGLIEGVDMERGRLKVSVNMFGRSTSLELEYWQVDKT
jgi:transcriptional antiterminator NusG